MTLWHEIMTGDQAFNVSENKMKVAVLAVRFCFLLSMGKKQQKKLGAQCIRHEKEKYGRSFDGLVLKR